MNKINKGLDIFTGTANPEFASEVSEILGIKISKADVGYFSDGELKVEIEENVRGHDTFIIQSTCSPTNKNVMEIMLIADALKRSSASRITAVVPYYGYARQDRSCLLYTSPSPRDPTKSRMPSSA